LVREGWSRVRRGENGVAESRNISNRARSFLKDEFADRIDSLCEIRAAKKDGQQEIMMCHRGLQHHAS